MCEYLSVRFDYRGRGITQGFNLLDVNGQRLTGWTSESKQGAKTLPEFLKLAGEDGEPHDKSRYAGECGNVALYAVQTAKVP